jgi:hypothetical protein
MKETWIDRRSMVFRDPGVQHEAGTVLKALSRAGHWWFSWVRIHAWWKDRSQKFA